MAQEQPFVSAFVASEAILARANGMLVKRLDYRRGAAAFLISKNAYPPRVHWSPE